MGCPVCAAHDDGYGDLIQETAKQMYLVDDYRCMSTL